ncbi:hypothetical protein B0H10DRAFT_2301342 [Mycena sp. CBHHK59/15]|nr:hypothetical protein B0H10DRAFT_2301342 [Mycena sp. CBHHK59/15]
MSHDNWTWWTHILTDAEVSCSEITEWRSRGQINVRDPEITRLLPPKAPKLLTGPPQALIGANVILFAVKRYLRYALLSGNFETKPGVRYATMTSSWLHMKKPGSEEGLLSSKPRLGRRLGIERLCEPKDAPTMEEWRKNRTIAYGSSQLRQGQEKGVEEEIISGVLVKHYN